MTVSAGPSADVLTRAEARDRAALVTGVHYAIDLDLDAGPEEFRSVTTVRFGCREPGAATFVDLCARSTGSVLLNGRPLGQDCYDGARLVVDDLRAENELVVEAWCAYGNAGVGMHRSVDPADGLVYLYTQFQPFDARRVYACFDQPDIKAGVDLTVRAPREWVVVGNGAARRAGDRWRFATTPPIPTYVTSIVAGPYHHVHDHHAGLPLGLYCRRSLAGHLGPEEVGELLELTRRGLDFYTALFDHPYPFDKYDQLFVPEFAMGAMENAGCVTIDERNVFRGKATEAQRLYRANVVLHEMAHMWFGNLVTMRWWDDLWLNEGFATYLASLALAEATRFGDHAWAEFAHLYKGWAYREDQRPTTHPIVADIPDTAGLLTHFDGITYAKGASVLKQLAHWVGPEAFRDGVRGYVAERAHGTGELSDFLRHLELASGRDLGRWERQWLHTAGLGVLRAETGVDDEGRYTSVSIVQDLPDGGPVRRAHRLRLGIYRDTGPDLTRVRQVEVDLDAARTAVPELAGEPAGGLVLLNDDDLAYTKVRLDRRSTETLTRGLSRIRSALTRTLCWGALWEATRDGELPTREWIELVAAHAPAETTIAVLQKVLTQAGEAIDQFAAPDRVAVLRRRLATAARAALTDAEPGSDAQLIWARRAIASDQDPAFARALLDGQIEIPGLVVDVDVRWKIVIRLAALGAADRALIAAERDRDPSDVGVRRAWVAIASLPDPAIKAKAFAAAVEGVADGRPLPLATQQAILGGFWRPEQSELLSDYADGRWIDALARVWSERGADEALALTASLIPATRATAAAVSAADRVLASDLLPPAGRRVLVEGHDDMRRALRAQTADIRAWTREGDEQAHG